MTANIKVLNKKPVTNKDRNNKIQSRIYHKTVDTVNEAVYELLSIPGYIDYIFADEIKSMSVDPEDEGYREISLTDLAYRMGDEFLRNLPNIITGENKFWQFSSSVDKTYIKTDKFIGFGWTIDKDSRPNEDGGFNIKSIRLTFTSYSPLRHMDEINYLEENGWVLQKDKER